MTLTGKQRAALRAQAHHLDPIVHVGQQGVTPAARASLDDALRARELVKIHVARAAGITARDAAQAFAATLGADVVQVIGRTATLFRPKPDERASAPPRPAFEKRPPND